MKKWISSVVSQTLAGALVAFASVCCIATPGEQSIRIGVTNAADAYWSMYRNFAADNGIAVSFVSFADYVQPMPHWKTAI